MTSNSNNVTCLLPEDEPIPQTLNQPLQSLLANFDNLEDEEREINNIITRIPPSQLPIEQDGGYDLHSYSLYVENEKNIMQHQDKLLLCKLLSLYQQVQELKKEVLSPLEEDKDFSLHEDTAVSSRDGEYAIAYDVAEGVEDMHAYQTLGEPREYETLLSQFNKTNEFS